MNSRLIGAVVASVTLLSSLSANAADVLLSRLGGQAYYDPTTNLTWLANANAAIGSAYDTSYPGSGRMNWNTANAWAASLDIGGVTGWRLPATLQPDSSCLFQDSSGSSGPYCVGSEMGHMFYNVLGGTMNADIVVVHNGNYDLFSNIEPSASYWSGTEAAPPNSNSAWYFDTYNGFQGSFYKTFSFYAWAVHDGDVATVTPAPASVYLLAIGLVGLIALARHRKAQ